MSPIGFNRPGDEGGTPRHDSKAFLMAALERIIDDMPGRDEDKLYEIEELADAVLDWLDRDTQTRLGDDEATFYERQDAAASPVDRPLFTLDELSTLPGMDDLLLEALKSYFVAHPMFPAIEQSGANLNTAAPHILGLIYYGTATNKQLLGNDEVFQILQARADGKVFCREGVGEDVCTSFTEVTGLLDEGIFPPLQYTSDIFTIRSEARVRNARFCVTTVVDRADPEEPETLSYRMEC